MTHHEAARARFGRRLDLPAGCVTLDTGQALSFVRAREVGGDFGRIERQHQFLRATLHALRKAAGIEGLPRVVATLEEISTSVKTDDTLRRRDAVTIARALQRLSGEQVKSLTVPTSPLRIGGVDFLAAVDDADELYERFREGDLLEVARAPPEPPAASQPPTGARPPTPGDMRQDEPDYCGETRSFASADAR